MKKLIRKLFRSVGLDLVRYPPSFDPVADLSAAEKAILQRVRPFTMTSVDRQASLLHAVRHVSATGIAGDIVECGVWRGGSMMVAALKLLELEGGQRSLYLYDTYEGMPPPTGVDERFDGVTARQQLDNTPKGEGTWCYAGLDDVRQNLFSTGYPREKLHFVRGKVEETIPGTVPERIALLRLDTDWYESTVHELKHLYPRLQPGGILILDDYGHWQGARKAVDEFLEAHDRGAYLHRIDYSGRMLIKPHACGKCSAGAESR